MKCKIRAYDDWGNVYDLVEHDREVYNKAINDFSKMCLKYKSKDNIIYFNEATLYMIAERLKGSR